jgi:putative SOS response-associated peptidase YedK
MCGRYLFYEEENIRLKKLLDAAKKKLPENEYKQLSLLDVCPGSKAFAGMYDAYTNHFHTEVMTWGYAGVGNGKIVINARSETCFSSSFFSHSRLCVLPATAYYEWSSEPRVKYRFSMAETPIYLGALCHKERDGFHFVIITEKATGRQREIHSRQPLMFTYEDAKTWCFSKNPTSLLSLSVQERTLNRL